MHITYIHIPTVYPYSVFVVDIQRIPLLLESIKTMEKKRLGEVEVPDIQSVQMNLIQI
jgi:hypothetical protein